MPALLERERRLKSGAVSLVPATVGSWFLEREENATYSNILTFASAVRSIILYAATCWACTVQYM